MAGRAPPAPQPPGPDQPRPDPRQPVGALLRDATRRLAAAGHPQARREAELLFEAVSGADRGQWYAHPEWPVAEAVAAAFAGLLQRRIAGEPVAHLLGRRDFYGLTLAVTAATLIPRPETELLVDLALERLPADAPLCCADLGTGSGAVALALAQARPAWTLLGIERAAAALAVAAGNQRRLGLSNLRLIQGDWLAAVGAECLDAVVANPPYLRADDPHLARGDLRFEPKAALAAGSDGLAALRVIIRQAPRALRPGGWLALEHGWDQGPAVHALLRRAGLVDPGRHRDLAGHWRVSSARREH